MDSRTKSVGKIIFDRRTALSLTQKDVADYVGVSEATVSRWESGHIDNMRRDRIAKLAKVLQISPLLLWASTSPPRPRRRKDMPFVDIRARHIQGELDACELGYSTQKMMKTLCNKLFALAIDCEM